MIRLPYTPDDEPICHSHVTDILPDDHLLAFAQVHCWKCGKLVHAGNNECMSTWFEFAGIVSCGECFAGYILSSGGVIEEHDFIEYLEKETGRKAPPPDYPGTTA